MKPHENLTFQRVRDIKRICSNPIKGAIMFRKWILWILAAGWILSACSPSQPTDSASPSAAPDSVSTTSANLPAESPPPGAESEFKTDFSKHNVAYREILSGGPPKDGIPPIDAPQFIPVKEANE